MRRSKVLMYADSVSTGATKAQAQFLQGAVFVTYGALKLEQAQTTKNSVSWPRTRRTCSPMRRSMLPKGGATAVDAMRRLMGAVMQLDPARGKHTIKQLCK
jgi:hypothetical protein